MKTLSRLTSLALSVTILLNAPIAAWSEVFELREGTVVRLKLTDTISSEDSIEGQRVNFEVVEDVLDARRQTVLIQAGSQAYGSISHVEERGGVGKAGELGLILERVVAVDGSKIPIRASLTDKGESKRGSAIAMGAVFGFIFLPGALFLLKRGKNAKIPAGSQLDAYINATVSIETDAPTVAKRKPVIIENESADSASDTSGSNPATPDYLKKYGDADSGRSTEVVTQPEDDASKNYIDELEALARLRKDGVITEAEFQAKKKQLLGL